MGIRIHIDRGGTFTDAIATFSDNDSEPVVVKLLSEDRENYRDAPLECVRRILEKVLNTTIGREDKLDLSSIDYIRCGTTVATNALLERKGESCAFITTKGFKDALIIGNQTRPRIFDLQIRKPGVLYTDVVEVDERVTLEDYSEDPAAHKSRLDSDDQELVLGLSGDVVRILQKPDPEKLRHHLKKIYEKGIRSLAICLAHSYTFADHEELIGNLAKEIGFTHISLSSKLLPMIKFVARANSVTAEAYLSPVVKRYLQSFEAGFSGSLRKKKSDKQGTTRCEFMQSDGGLVDITLFSGLKAILSGPAGGVVGYSLTSYDQKSGIPVIGFDMGGTSTDVSRYGGSFEHVYETTTAGITIQSPQLDINTVAAGGGSMLFWKNGLFVVGPESAGADPGPACYRKGGPLTITDANLLVGRILPEFFPKIFGEKGNESLDIKRSEQAFKELAADINRDLDPDRQLSIDEIAYGFLQIANETMSRPIRSLTEAKGLDASAHRLATFGGAGGQHAVAIAEVLGISQVVIHKYSSVLSAYGMALADVISELQEPCSEILEDGFNPKIKDRLEEIQNKVSRSLLEQGFMETQIEHTLFLNCRYQGTDTSIMVDKPAGSWAFKDAFITQHQKEFGFILPERDIVIDDIRVRGKGKSVQMHEKSIDDQLSNIQTFEPAGSKIYGVREVYFENRRQSASIYKIQELNAGSKIIGPAILVDETQTIIIPPNAAVTVLSTHIIIDIGVSRDIKEKKAEVSTEKIDPVLLSVFESRFMAIAEQMGRVLQKTSVSTNVKERLDYSCALFDADGGLVANAPHLPVHLGSMSTCVKLQANMHKDKLKPGDVLLTNHPSYGGTHLPDITAITPHFHGKAIVFFVASRAHHADIGGTLPGSMPPASKQIFEEGASIKSIKIVKEGIFDEETITNLLVDEAGKHPGCSGTRCLRDNISDLKAQVAANQRGIYLINELISEYSEPVVQFYMRSIEDNAEQAVKVMLRKMSEKFNGKDLIAEDFMDDGSRIRLRVTINKVKGEATFDFTGTGPEVYGNWNAPEAVTYSAIIYCLRCLITESIPLNQGCLRPINVIIPAGSMLSPSETAAVVGGNVLTSQRITDTIFRAFEACAASQGDCNNLTFGIGGKDSTNGKIIPGFGYYETICGGSGAGPGYNGTSGVHTHMTNTRITDLEIFERRYPVILRNFGIRTGSGGRGKYNGGDGIIREVEFRIPMTVSILSERRAFRPYGLHGGEDAQCGMNLWVRKGNKEKECCIINLGGKNTTFMDAGDRIVIQTPGGGGYGNPEKVSSHPVASHDPLRFFRCNGSISSYSMAQETV